MQCRRVVRRASAFKTVAAHEQPPQGAPLHEQSPQGARLHEQFPQGTHLQGTGQRATLTATSGSVCSAELSPQYPDFSWPVRALHCPLSDIFVSAPEINLSVAIFVYRQ